MKINMKTPPVKGWNEPHIWIKNQKILLTKEDAREKSIEYYTEYFNKSYSIILKKVEVPQNKGEYKITMFVTENSNKQEFKLQYHTGDGLYEIELEITKKSSGVSHRELFIILIKILEDEYFDDEEEDSSIKINFYEKDE